MCGSEAMHADQKSETFFGLMSNLQKGADWQIF